MRGHDPAPATLVRLAAAGVIVLAGCANMGDPRPPLGWLPAAESEVREPLGYGAWAALLFRTSPLRLEGELIAFDRDSVFLFTVGGVEARPVADLRRVALVLPRPESRVAQAEWFGADRIQQLAGYARFPGGVPPGVDVRGLLPRRGVPAHRPR